MGNRYSIFILALLFTSTNLKAQGLVAQKISATEGNFHGELHPGDQFGEHLAGIGDLDGDGVADLAATSENTLWILFLNRDGTVKKHREIRDTIRSFGEPIATAGDIDADGYEDLVVGSTLSFLYLEPDGSGSLSREIVRNPAVRVGVANVGDINGDGFPEFAVGTGEAGEGGRGGVTIYFVHPDLSRYDLIGFGHETGGFGPIELGDNTGASIASLSSFRTDSKMLLAVGEPKDGDAGAGSGTVWLVELGIAEMLGGLSAEGAPRIVLDAKRIDARSPGLQHAIFSGDHFGSAVANLGDLDDNGADDLAVGAPDANGAGFNQGSVWIVFLNLDGSIKATRTIGTGDDADLTIPLSDSDQFGSSLAALGDVNGDGIGDVAVGANGEEEMGEVWIVFGLTALPSEIELFDPTEQPVLGREIPVEAKITGVSGIESVEISFRRGGDPSFFSTGMIEQSSDLYSYSIPAAAVNSRGIEYFVTATNTAGTATKAPTQGAVSLPVTVPEGLDMEVPSGNDANGYRLVSFPLRLDNSDARSVFESSLGSYDPAAWRLFSLNPTGSYVDVGNEPIDIIVGQAYWLLSRDENRHLNSTAGISVSTAQPFPIRINPGWTLVSSPFNFNVPLENLHTGSGDAIDLRSYDGSWSQMDGPLEPFSGYAAFSDRLDTLWIDLDEASKSGMTSSNQLGEISARKQDGRAWSVRVSGVSGASRDVDNIFGVAPEADEGWDAFDRPEPPPIGEYVSVYFPHDEWRRVTSRFNADIRPSSDRENVWKVAVESPDSRIVELRFDQVETVPPDLSIWLVDRSAGHRQDIRANPTYRLVSGTPESSRFVELIVGIDQPVENPSEARIDLGVFPNPLTTAATLTITLPEASRSRLAIYDVLGRTITTLLDGERLAAGTTTAVWDGHTSDGIPAASGMYLVRLELNDRTVTRAIAVTQ